MAFMGHGLFAAFFIMAATVAAVALSRMRTHLFQFPAWPAATFLFGVLVLCKSIGALVFGMLIAPLVRFASPATQCRIAVVLAVIALSFPGLRFYDLFPTSATIELVNMFSEERAESLKFRFDNEDLLLERASERIWFGWGRYGRNRVYAEDDGRDLTITDGYWIIMLGQFGWIGFAAAFLLLTVPVFRALAAVRLIKTKYQQISLSAIALIVAITAIDQLPNGSLNPWTWLLAGSLLGQAESQTRLVKRLNLLERSPA